MYRSEAGRSGLRGGAAQCPSPRACGEAPRADLPRHPQPEAAQGPEGDQRSRRSASAFEHPEFVPAGFAEVLEGIVGTSEHGLSHFLRRQVGSQVALDDPGGGPFGCGQYLLGAAEPDPADDGVERGQPFGGLELVIEGLYGELRALGDELAVQLLPLADLGLDRARGAPGSAASARRSRPWPIRRPLSPGSPTSAVRTAGSKLPSFDFRAEPRPGQPKVAGFPGVPDLLRDPCPEERGRARPLRARLRVAVERARVPVQAVSPTPASSPPGR